MYDDRQLLSRVEAQIKPISIFWIGRRIPNEKKRTFQFIKRKTISIIILICFLGWGIKISPIVPSLHWHYDLLILMIPILVAIALWFRFRKKVITFYTNTSSTSSLYTLRTHITYIETVQWLHEHQVSTFFVEEYLLPVIERDANLRHEFSTRVLVKSILIGSAISFPIFITSISLNLVITTAQYEQNDTFLNEAMIILLGIYSMVFVCILGLGKSIMDWVSPTYSTKTYREVIRSLRRWLIDQKSS